MCGIWALIEKNVQLTSEILQAYNSIKPRGPDTSTLHVDQNYIAGFHRLAINDLSINGNQPFHLSMGEYDYMLICNGEIYNHRELSDTYELRVQSSSDCDVLLPLFIYLKEDFKEFNNMLRGEYALVIIKKHRKSGVIQFFASTDPYSVRPLFWANEGVKVYFSSLLSGISPFSRNVNRLGGGEALTGYLDFNKYTDSTSGLVRNLFINDSIKVSEYYNFNHSRNFLTTSPSGGSYYDESLYENAVSVLQEAVKIRLHSDRPIGCLLSGGLDSSLVAALAAKELKKTGQRLRTFSIGMEGGTDLKYARMVAEHIDSIHTEYLFTPEIGLSVIDDVIKATETYDITTIRASVGQFLLARAISKDTDIKVILNGDGADEVQMGYLYFYLHPNLGEADRERDMLLRQIHQFDGLRVDRNISYHGLEARVPFLDKEFVKFMRDIDTEELVPTKDRMEKYFIRKAFEREMPGLLPKEVLWRKKEAFSDGVSSKEKSWYLILKDHFRKIVGDDSDGASSVSFSEKVAEYKAENIDGIKPVCHESYYYRTLFNELFNHNHKVIPRYWLPNWTNASDPSARTLQVYTDS